MATVRVVLRKCRKLKDGRYPIVIGLTHNKKVKYISTGYSALEKEWKGAFFQIDKSGKSIILKDASRIDIEKSPSIKHLIIDNNQSLAIHTICLSNC